MKQNLKFKRTSVVKSTQSSNLDGQIENLNPSESKESSNKPIKEDPDIKERFLEKTNRGLDFYEKFLGTLKVNGSNCENTHNPFYEDKNPSFSVYYNLYKKRWCHKDFGDNNYLGDIFDFIGLVFGLNPSTHFLDIIYQAEILLGIYKGFFKVQSMKMRIQPVEDGKLIKREKMELPKEETQERPFTLRKREKLNKEEIEYFDQFGITEKILKQLKVSMITGFEAINSNGKHYSIEKQPGQIMYAVEGKGHAKIVFANPKGFSTVGNRPKDYITGLQLPRRYKELALYPEDYELFIFAAGEKDTLTLQSMGYHAGCCNSESTPPSEEMMKKIKIAFKHVLFLYDNDETGIKSAKELGKKYNVPYLILPEIIKEKGGKDISDWIKLKLGKDEIHKLINITIEEFYKKKELITPVSSDISETHIQESVSESEFAEFNKIDEFNICENDEESVKVKPSFHSPLLSNEIIKNLPEIFQKILKVADSDREKDLYTLSSLGVLSGVFQKISGLYGKTRSYCNLNFLFIAPAAAGKSPISHCRYLAEPIEEYLEKLYDDELKQYDEKLKESIKDKNKLEPELPKRKTHFISGDATKAGLIENLHDNGGTGTILESETDVVGNSFGSEHGDYSSIARLAFHGEKISTVRKNGIRIIIPKCQMPIILCGTPNQVLKLVPDIENGMASRMCIYTFPSNPEWINPFENNSIDIHEYFKDLGKGIVNLYKKFKSLEKDVDFRLTQEQIAIFNETFSQWKSELTAFYGEDFSATIHRLGIINFRIAMVISASRLIGENVIPTEIVCSDKDFNSAISISKILKQHAVIVLGNLPKPEFNLKFSNEMQEVFYKALPDNFEKQDVIQIAKKLNLNQKTADRYLTIFPKLGLIKREGKGRYRKL